MIQVIMFKTNQQRKKTMLSAHTVGNKYKEVQDLRPKEIAKLIRKDLKKFKDCKFSVKSDYNAINVKLIECTNLDRFEMHEYYHHTSIRMNNDFMKEVKTIMNQYNFDNSDTMSDYFHNNFFAFFDLAGQLARDTEPKLIEKLKAA